MDTYEKLEKLTYLAKNNESLRLKLLATKEGPDPMKEFCLIVQAEGVELYLGELFSLGLEASDNQCKSTNGGNPTPYTAFDDAYENFLMSIS